MRRLTLRHWLVATDILVLTPAWLLAPMAPWVQGRPQHWWLAVPGFVLVTLLLLTAAGLYRARVCTVRATEVGRLAAVSAGLGLAGLWGLPHIASQPVATAVATASLTGFFALGAGRAVYRNWLLAQRATGKRLREVAIIGADEEAGRIGAHLAEHPEVGYEVIGYFRSAAGHAAHLARPILGRISDVSTVLERRQISGAIVVPGALLPDECDAVLAALADAKAHVHLATGLRGIDSRRLRSLPMGHEPLLYLEPAGASSPWYGRLQRVLDVVGAVVALVLAAPLLLIAAVAIKLTDGGPVLFRQERAGKGSRPFPLYKLRSMSADAEERLPDLLAYNERDGGPLFKLTSDPRVTKVGAILRATSFDEVPQLFNVLRGEMSLVGPRPALLDEVATFDDELMMRQQVRPGVTGLWQVEARDNPSFSAYRYLDVFYVENQSLALDLTILMATVRAVASSCFRAIRLGRELPEHHPSFHLTDDELEAGTSAPRSDIAERGVTPAAS